MIITLQKRGTITVSKEMRDKLGIEPGDPLDVTIEEGRLVLTPVDMIPRTIRLTPKGEKREAEADEDIRQGRVTQFDTVEEMLKDFGEA